MSENEDQSPFGRGFIAAAIVIVTILACGGILLVTGLTADPTPPADQTSATHPSGRSDPARRRSHGSPHIVRSTSSGTHPVSHEHPEATIESHATDASALAKISTARYAVSGSCPGPPTDCRTYI